MSFAGHKSPFAERAKAAKSHLSPRRTSTASGVGNFRSAQQSLFGKESSTSGGDSSAKVGQLRNAQPDVKEPTTPTRASEQKGNRRDEFSSFNSRRVGTPIKTPRMAFGTTPPRSPKRPYMGSPKYQKVLLERPAFYNSPTASEPPIATESGRKEVSISELQKRLKRFLQDENVPSQLEVTPCNHLEEVPFNISRSPRVNPLYHHDETVLHVAKGGVAFTAGVTDTNGIHTRPGGVAFTVGVADTACTPTGPVALIKEEADVSAPLPSNESSSPNSQSISHDEPASAKDISSPNRQCISHDEPASASDVSCDNPPELEQLLRSEDFPVHSEVENVLQMENRSQVEEGCAEDVSPSALVVPEVGSNSGELENQAVTGLTSPIVEVQGSEGSPLLNFSGNESLKAQYEEQRAAVEHQLETKADSISEEEDEETEVLESWSQRFLKFVVLAVVVACVMGFMVLASGSHGLLPQRLHSKTSPYINSPLSTSVIPVAIGFMGLGREHEGMQCLPAVHLKWKCLSRGSASRREDSSSSLSSISVARKNSNLAGIDNVGDREQLRTVTDHYKELQGRLFSDVASLTSEIALFDATKAGSGMEDLSEIGVLEDVVEVASAEDVTEVATMEVVSEVAAMEQLVATEDVFELGNEIAEELQLDTQPFSDEHGREEVEIAGNLECLPTVLDTTLEPDSHELPADVKLDASNPVNHDELHAVSTASIDTTELISSVLRDSELGSEPQEVTPSLSMKETAFPVWEISRSDVPPVTQEVSIVENPIESTAQETDWDIISGSSVEDLVEDHEEVHAALNGEKSESQSTTDVLESDMQSHREVSFINVVIPEESTLNEQELTEGFYPVIAIGLLVAALAIAVPLVLKSQKSAKRVTLASAIEAETAAGLKAFPAAQLKTMSSPVAWSAHDSRIPDRDELDAINSQLKSPRTQRNYSLESFSTKFEPALSTPGLFQPRVRVEPRPATTWHPAMRAGSNTISTSGYRQTASYIPTIPTESGISTSTRGASDTDSVCESALTMGAEEWEHLGSFTTTELLSVNEQGGGEHKIRTPVRRSQRIRNRVSPLPVKFT